jgi:hypothetical protein
MINEQAPQHISPLLPIPVVRHSNYSRNNVIPRFSRLHSSITSFPPNTTRNWNSLSTETRAAPTINIYKKLLIPNRQTNHYFKIHQGRGGVWLSRIWMGLSGLNE